MNVYSAILIALLALPLSQEPQPAPASLRGVVIDAATDMPVAGATVELTRIEGGRVVSRSNLTGTDGTFAFTALPPGSDYELMTSNGTRYQPGAFGQHTIEEPWTTLTLAPGENKTNVRLLLTPLGSITGKVVDGDGKALERAKVSLLRATYGGVRRILQYVGEVNTNGHGEYFFGSLGTGQYYLRVNPSNDSDFRLLFENPAAWDSSPAKKKAADPDGYPTTYYPATRDLTVAKPVDLLFGGTKVDINIKVAKVKTRRVSGTVTNAANGQLLPDANVLLVPRATGPESSLTRVIRSSGKPGEGEFDFRGVLPGAYNLVAMAKVGNARLTVSKPIEVGGTDLPKMSLAVAPGFDIPGTIEFSDWVSGRPPDFSQLAINLVSSYFTPIDQALPRYEYAGNAYRAVPTTEGAFLIHDVPPGDYRIILSLNPNMPAGTKLPIDMKAAYMMSAKLGNKDMLEEGLHVEGTPENKLQVSVVTNSGSVFGRVLDDRKEPVVPARMMIVPDKARRLRFDLYSPVPVSPTGRFTLDGIPPGEYKLFAWSHVVDGAWYDPEFMRVYEDRGTTVHIEESGTIPIEVPLLH